MNAQWHVRGVDQNDQRQFVFLASADLKDPRKAKKRAADEAKRRWLKKGLRVRVVAVYCVG
jgi:hypothetical protein